MNTANLQLEGLLLAVSSLLESMRRKGLLSESEIRAALDEAETCAALEAEKHQDLTAAQQDGIKFPIRFLQAATNLSNTGKPSFADIAAIVGQTKPSA